MSLIYGIAMVALIWWLARVFARANPKTLASTVKRVGGGLLLGLAALMLFRGRIDMAFLVGSAGVWLLGWGVGLRLPGIRGGATRSPGSTSRVRSAMVEMELDHDTGAMRGTVLAGPFSGRALDALSPEDLQRLAQDCAHQDPDSLRLLEAYLDRRFPGRREHAERDQDPGSVRQPQPAAMTEEEAYQILGLQPGASLDEVRRAHRTLMKRLHPDQGGSTYLAARVNQAKDILVSRHR